MQIWKAAAELSRVTQLSPIEDTVPLSGGEVSSHH